MITVLLLIDKSSRELEFGCRLHHYLLKKNIFLEIDQQDIYNKGTYYDFFERVKKKI